ncbi:MAG: hypothetical protein KDC43_29360 [Saprospiraceae bacterium]|nr:hypothetical protein [Saprospiraceae bacterium]
MSVAIYRIRKNKISKKTGQLIPTPGAGLRLANKLNADVWTSKTNPSSIDDKTVVINYGRSLSPDWIEKFNTVSGKILNSTEAVSLAVDKRKTLKILELNNIPCLIWTTVRSQANNWLDAGFKVIARLTAKGKMGNGIVLVNPGEVLPDAELYTSFYEKTHEFRVHVFKGKVIDYVQKKKMGSEKLSKYGLSEANDIIRNHKRGWVFARHGIYNNEYIKTLAINAVESLGLDFAAVDILAKIDNDLHEVVHAVVCEVNSAPGMSDKNTFNAYTNAFNKYIESVNQVNEGII